MMEHVLTFRDPKREYGPPITGRLWDHASGTRVPEKALEHVEAVTLLIHGYNVTELAGRARMAAFASILQHAPRPRIGVTWPGDDKLGALAFPGETADADMTARELVEWLRRETPRATVHVVAHSLGCRVAMKAVKQMAGRASGPRPGRVVLLAAAIDADSLAQPNVFEPAARACEAVDVLASKGDTVLRWAYPFGDLADAVGDDDGFGFALGRRGPRAGGRKKPVPPNVRHVRVPQEERLRHGHYFWEHVTGPEGKPADAALREPHRDEVAAWTGRRFAGDPNLAFHGVNGTYP